MGTLQLVAGCHERQWGLRSWSFSRPGWRKPQGTWSDIVAAAVLSMQLHWWPPVMPSRLGYPSRLEECPGTSLCCAYLF